MLTFLMVDFWDLLGYRKPNSISGALKLIRKIFQIRYIFEIYINIFIFSPNIFLNIQKIFQTIYILNIKIFKIFQIIISNN